MGIEIVTVLEEVMNRGLSLPDPDNGKLLTPLPCPLNVCSTHCSQNGSLFYG